AGAAAASSGERGVANVTAELLRQGTVSRDHAAFDTELDKLGGEIGASGTRDYTTIAGTFLARDFEAGMDLMSDAVIHPMLAEKDLVRVRSRTLLTMAQ